MLIDDIASEEGMIPYIYLDSRGNPTCGVGMLLTTASDVDRFRWTDQTQARQDYKNALALVAAGSYGPAWPASRYAKLMRARMLDSREGLADQLATIEGCLVRQWYGYNILPPGVQEAMVDMAFNLGVNGLVKGYPKMIAHLGIGQYAQAAKESHRKGISDARNARTAAKIATGK